MRYALIACLLMGCGNDPQEISQSSNPNMTVEKLFEYEGCTVYRFYDYGRAIYYTDCAGSTAWNIIHNHGKGRTTTENVEVSGGAKP